jgi:cytochrome P450
VKDRPNVTHQHAQDQHDDLTSYMVERHIDIFLGAANRDPREWDDTDRFDIRRRAVTHLAFGSGVHACVGAAIARLEAECLLTALARQARTLELVGPPRPRPHNILRSLADLPLQVGAA